MAQRKYGATYSTDVGTKFIGTKLTRRRLKEKSGRK